MLLPLFPSAQGSFLSWSSGASISLLYLAEDSVALVFSLFMSTSPSLLGHSRRHLIMLFCIILRKGRRLDPSPPSAPVIPAHFCRDQELPARVVTASQIPFTFPSVPVSPSLLVPRSLPSPRSPAAPRGRIRRALTRPFPPARWQNSAQPNEHPASETPPPPRPTAARLPRSLRSSGAVAGLPPPSDHGASFGAQSLSLFLLLSALHTEMIFHARPRLRAFLPLTLPGSYPRHLVTFRLDFPPLGSFC